MKMSRLSFKPVIKKIKTSGGFTLIEMLVVIAIISLILTIAAVNYASANKRARDGRRKADLEQIRSALEMYRADNPAIGYPNVANYSALAGPLSNYINPFPNDPQNVGLSYTYYYVWLSTTTYRLCTVLEAGGGSGCTSNPSCGGGTTCNDQKIQP